MNKTDSILKTIRKAVGLIEDDTSFDTDLLVYINSAVGELNQVGFGKSVFVTDESTTWEELIDPVQVMGNDAFSMVPSFVLLSVKLPFDPPPPSAVEFHKSQIDKLLWRIKVAYEPISVSVPPTDS